MTTHLGPQRIAFIGMGNRARAHLRTVLRWFPDRAAVVGAADAGLTGEHFTRHPLAVVGWPDEIPVDRRFAEYRELLALPDVDAVVIATPEVSHLELAVAALDAGKAVLLEKAAVVSLEEAERLYERLTRGGGRFQLALNLRHHEVVRTMRRLVEARAIGRVVSATAHVNAGHAWGSGVFRRFHRNASLDGDVVLSKLTHDSDVLHHVLGTYVETVTGVAEKTTFVPRPGAGTHCRECAITAECHEYVDALATRESQLDDEQRMAYRLTPADVCPYTAPSTSHDTASFSGVYASGAAFSMVFTTAGPVYQRRYHLNGTGGEIVATIGGREGHRVTVHTIGAPAVDVPIDVGATAVGGHGGADPRLWESFLDYLDGGVCEPAEPEAVLSSVMLPIGGLRAAADGRALKLGEWYRRVVAEEMIEGAVALHEKVGRR
jgi:predicted dehydrogenase